MKSLFKKTIIILLGILVWNHELYSQITLAFQGGELNDTWGFVSTGASNVANTQASNSANYKTGTKSIVVGGLNSGGGNCFSGGGSGNGTVIDNKFTFNSISIATSSNYNRTLTFNYGNRYPICNGTGYDTAEDLIFVAFHDGIAQTPITIEVGGADLSLNIKTKQYSYTVPPCVQQFHFEISVSTNRTDELLFLDDVKLVAPQLNSANINLSTITGNSEVCEGSTNSYQVDPIANITYQWGGLPSTATFTTPNNTSTSNSMSIDWGNTVPGTYTLSVTPNYQNCGTATAGNPQTKVIEVIEKPSISINGITTICPGESTTLTASGGNNTFVWSNNLGTSNSITVSPTTSTSYTVTGTNGTCENTASTNVNITGSITLTFSGNTSICEGGTTTITVQGATNYNWDNNLGTQSSIVVSPTTTTTYTVTGSVGMCETTANVTVNVQPNSTILTINGNNQICEGDNTTLTVSGGTNYTWNNNLGTQSSITVSPTTTTTYTVSSTNGLCTSQASIIIDVKPNPVISITGPTSFCVGNPITLTANGATSYVWGNNLGTTESITVSPQITTTYTVVGDLNGCTNTASKTVVYNSPSITVNATKLIVCEGESTTLSTNSSDPIIWTNSINSDTIFDTYYTITPITTTTYTANTLNSSCNASGSITIMVESKPVVSFTADKLEGCAPLVTQFTNTTEGNVTFNWNFGDGNTSNLTNPSHTYLQPNCYTVSLTATSQSGCSTTTTTIDYICAFENPIADFSASTYEIDDWNSTVNFTNSSIGAIDYNWKFGQLNTSNETNPEFTFPKDINKNYNVTLIVTNNHGCVDSTTKLIKYIEQLIYYIPNAFTPDGNELNQVFTPIFTSGFDPFNYTMRIFNRWGELIFETHNHTEGWSGQTVTEQFAPIGTYTYQILFNLKGLDDTRKITGSVALIR